MNYHLKELKEKDGKRKGEREGGREKKDLEL